MKAHYFLFERCNRCKTGVRTPAVREKRAIIVPEIAESSHHLKFI